MQIVWYGGSCFKLISSELSVLTDPFSLVSERLRNPRLTSEVVLFSNPSVLKKKEEKNNFFLIATPGEYEIKNIFILGLPYFENNVLKIIYKMEIEEVKICFLGEVFKRSVSEELKKLGEIEILFVPFTISQPFSAQLASTIKEVPSKIIIPYFLATKEDKLKPKIVDKFIKKIGWQNFERTAKLKIRKKDLSSEKTKLIVLEPFVH